MRSLGCARRAQAEAALQNEVGNAAACLKEYFDCAHCARPIARLDNTGSLRVNATEQAMKMFCAALVTQSR